MASPLACYNFPTSMRVTLLRQHLGDTLDEKGAHYLSKISNASHHMGELIDNLLEFSRIGRAELRPSSFEFAALVSSVVQSQQESNPEREVDWKIGELPKVYADKALLRQVLVNLVDNAMKFTCYLQDARIEIGVVQPDPNQEESAQEIVFFVRDNGAGFDIRYIDKLFQVFQRLHRMDEFEGTGQGLSLAYSVIVEQHKGKIEAHSVLGEGTTFIISLPLTDEFSQKNPPVQLKKEFICE